MAVTVLAPNWYDDHWTGLDCDLEIRGAGALRLRLYLPADATMPETKSLAIWQGDRLHHVEVHRRVFTDGGVFEARDGRISLRLCAGHAEHARPDDDRLLGVSLWIETLDGQQIEPAIAPPTDPPATPEDDRPAFIPAPQATADTDQGPAPPHPDAAAIGAGFDSDFYLSCFGPDDRPADPLRHYLAQGWQEGRDPTPWFSTRHYLATHRDVQAAGMNPFVHYCIQGVREGRALPVLGRKSAAPYAAHVTATAPGPV